MTQSSDIRSGVARKALSHQDQMVDAQSLCVPCKLCGRSAVITDAGEGQGYYIRCGGWDAFRPWRGCLITDSRVSGWAYNASDWWNRLHASPALSTPAEPKVSREAVEEAERYAAKQDWNGAYHLMRVAYQGALSNPPADGDGWRDIETCPMWQVAFVTDGEQVAKAQKAETDFDGFYWAIEPEDCLEWEPTHWIEGPPPSAPLGAGGQIGEQP